MEQLCERLQMLIDRRAATPLGGGARCNGNDNDRLGGNVKYFADLPATKGMSSWWSFRATIC
jgi:hypothetical protein